MRSVELYVFLTLENLKDSENFVQFKSCLIYLDLSQPAKGHKPDFLQIYIFKQNQDANHTTVR